MNRKLPRDFFYAEGQSRDTYESKVLEPDDDINLSPVNDEDIS